MAEVRELRKLLSAGFTMHELSIARSILRIVQDRVSDSEHGAVRQVRIRLGECAGVSFDSLQFCYHALIQDSGLSNSSLCIDRIPFVIKCSACGATSACPDGTTRCPRCSSPETAVVSGQELGVAAIELVEETSHADDHH